MTDGTCGESEGCSISAVSVQGRGTWQCTKRRYSTGTGAAAGVGDADAVEEEGGGSWMPEAICAKGLPSCARWPRNNREGHRGGTRGAQEGHKRGV